MIEAKETLIGNISSKKTLTGKINNAIEKVYPELEDITITPSSKEQHFKSDKYGYGSITVEKVSDEYIIPTGDLEINSNGIYDVKEKVNAIVNVPEKQLGTKVIDKNGIYNATDDNLDGYSSVDVQTSGADLNEYFNSEFKTTFTSSTNVLSYSVKKLPNITLAPNFTSCSYMFYRCKALEEIPQLDTSSVTNMSNMFSGCSSLKTISLLNTSKVTNMATMFSNCSALEEIPQLDTSSVTNMSNMFLQCSSLKTIPLLNTSKVTNMSQMFSGCSALEEIPQLDTSNVANFGTVFQSCSALEEIPQLDFSKVEQISFAFNSCTILTTLGGFKNIGMAYLTTANANYSNYSINLSSSSKLTHDSLMNVINNLYDIASAGVQPQKLVLGTTNLNKLSDEEKLLVQNKGWNLS